MAERSGTVHALPLPRFKACTFSVQPMNAMPFSASSARLHSSPTSSLETWAFDDPPHTLAYTSSQVLKNDHPVLLVVHEDDGDWQFLHGVVAANDQCRTIRLGRAVLADPSLSTLADLPCGWRAYRTLADGHWHREPCGSHASAPLPRAWRDWLSRSALTEFRLWK